MNKYIVKDYDFSKTLLDNILHNRGIEDIEGFLDLDCQDQDPLHFSNMQLGCGILYEHIKRNNKIVVVVDSDNDGYTSSAILIRYLTTRYPNIDITPVVQEVNKAHGFNEYIFNKIEELEPKLVIMPDAGSSDITFHNKLIDKGIQLLILDHHQFDEADTIMNTCKGVIIINNHAVNDVNKYISAAGVVYLFISLYDNIIFDGSLPETLLDIVALGLIADACDMRDVYTRKTTILGLDNISNEFMNALIERQSAKIKKINIMSIGFYVSPLVNACIRISDKEDRLKVFKALAYGIDIDEAVEICVKAKSKQDRMRDKEIKLIEEMVKEKNLDDLPALVVIKNDIPPAIIGLVANKLSDKYNKPAIVLRENEGIYTGSIRNKIDAIDFKEFLEGTNIPRYVRG